MKIFTIIIVTLLSINAVEVMAKVGPITLQELVKKSDFIGVIRIDAIEHRALDENSMIARFTDAKSSKVAKFSVLDSWKGGFPKSFKLLASPTWTCDTTRAEVDEELVSFLYFDEINNEMRVLHAGRGLMPLNKHKGDSYVKFWNKDVLLPSNTQTTATNEGYQFIRLVKLNQLKKLVKDFASVKRP